MENNSASSPMLPWALRLMALALMCVISWWLWNAEPPGGTIQPLGGEALLSRYFPDDVDGVGVFRFHQFRNTPLYERLQEDDQSALWAGRVDAAFREAGFAFQQLHAFAFSWKAGEGDKPLPLAALSGTFERDAFLRGAEVLLGVDGEKESFEGYDGVKVLSENLIFISPEPGVILVGAPERVIQGLAVARKETPSVWGEHELKTLAEPLGAEALLWTVGDLKNAVGFSPILGPHESGGLGVRRFALSLQDQKEGSMAIHLALESESEEAAAKVVQGARMWSALVGKMVSKDTEESPLTGLLNQIQIARDGKGIVFSLRLEKDVLEDLTDKGTQTLFPASSP